MLFCSEKVIFWRGQATMGVILINRLHVQKVFRTWGERIWALVEMDVDRLDDLRKRVGC